MRLAAFSFRREAYWLLFLGLVLPLFGLLLALVFPSIARHRWW